MHHIDDFAKVGRHDFENLICLCAVCHHRATVGEIDRLAMLQYKANLGLLTNRYGEMERRLLERWARAGATSGAAVVMPGGLDLMYAELIRDGLVTMTTSSMSSITDALGPVTATLDGDGRQVVQGPDMHLVPIQMALSLTDAGADFVRRLASALPLDGD